MSAAQKEKDAFRKRALKAQAQVTAANEERKRQQEAKANAPPAAAQKTTQAKKAPARPKKLKASAHSNLPSCIFDALDYLRKNREYVHIDTLIQEGVLNKEKRRLTATDVEILKKLLRDSPKTVFEGETCKFQPTHDVHNFDELVAHLMHFDAEGLGGIRVDELQESYDGVDMDIKRLKEEKLVYIFKRHDRGNHEVLFYRSPPLDMEVDEEVRQLWRKASVEGKHLTELNQYLEKADLTPLKVERVLVENKKKKRKRRAPMAGIATRQATSLKVTDSGDFGD